jgi:hypothetical protein
MKMKSMFLWDWHIKCGLDRMIIYMRGPFHTQTCWSGRHEVHWQIMTWRLVVLRGQSKWKAEKKIFGKLLIGYVEG